MLESPLNHLRRHAGGLQQDRPAPGYSSSMCAGPVNIGSPIFPLPEFIHSHAKLEPVALVVPPISHSLGRTFTPTPLCTRELRVVEVRQKKTHYDADRSPLQQHVSHVFISPQNRRAHHGQQRPGCLTGSLPQSQLRSRPSEEPVFTLLPVRNITTSRELIWDYRPSQ